MTLPADLRAQRIQALERKRDVAPNGCWLWTGYIRPRDGYGIYYMSVPRKRQTFVHRLAYELFVGPIPDGHSLHHTCEVRHCFNPEHVVPVTHAEHMKIHRSEVCRHCGHSEFTPWDHSCRECHRRRARARYYAKKKAAV